MKSIIFLLSKNFWFSFLIIPFVSCGQNHVDISKSASFKEMKEVKVDDIPNANKVDTATFAAGCFWCVESQFQQLDGVKKVISGFTGGTVVNPDYDEVCTGSTGHAEACHIVYDPKKISYDELLAAFFVAHDPTQLNRQGNDVGTQYRSEIFYHNKEQKQKAEYYIKKLNEEKAYPTNIVTAVSPLKEFYIAENYHQDYYNNNKNQPYCKYVIQPKLEKFRKVFKEKLRVRSEE